VIDKLDKALDTVRAEHPGFEIASPACRRSPRATAPT
jgi:hypothetical protein